VERGGGSWGHREGGEVEAWAGGERGGRTGEVGKLSMGGEGRRDGNVRMQSERV